jgi:hypothetical protein
LAQLPQAHSIIQTFHNHVRNKKNELLRQQVAFPPYNYFPHGLEPKRRVENPTSYQSHLLPMLPYFANPDVHIPPPFHRPQPPPSFTLQNQVSLPEGELVSNSSNLGIDWGKTAMKEFDLLGELGMHSPH